MICPSCNTRYVDGMTLCPDCDIPLLEEEEARRLEEAIGNLQSEWLHVYTTNTEIDARMVESFLTSAGIPTHVLLQIDTTRQLTVGGLAVAKIFVRDSDAEDALAIIRDIERRRNEPDEPV